jgi:cytochrome P450
MDRAAAGRVRNTEDPPPGHGAPGLSLAAACALAALITRFANARAALSDPRLSKDARHGAAELEAAGIAEAYIGERALLDGSMLGADPPEHTRLRRLVAGQFTGRRTAQLAPRIQQLSDQLIDGFPPAPPWTAGSGTSSSWRGSPTRCPLVIAELLGVPPEDRERFHTWSQVLGFMGSALRFRFGCAAWASGHGSLPCRPDLPGSARRPVDAREALVLIRPRDSQLA